MSSIGTSRTKLSKVLYGAALFGLVLFSAWFINMALNSQTTQSDAAYNKTAELGAISKDLRGVGDTKELSVAKQKIFSTPRSLVNNLGANTLLETDIDGAVRTDANGNLIVDQALRDYFDYFLSASDEIGPEVAIQAALELINQSLPTAAAEQAGGVFQRYLQYLREHYRIGDQPLIGEVNNDAGALLVLKETTQALRDVRKRLFTDKESQALFGLEDANADFTLKSLELFADESLSLDQQRAELERLQSELPESLQESTATSMQQKLEQAKIEALLKQKFDDAQLYTQLRDLNLSVEHVQSLLAYRQNKDHFEQQYQRYTLAKEQQGEASYTTSLLEEFFPTPEAQTAARLRDLKSQ